MKKSYFLPLKFYQPSAGGPRSPLLRLEDFPGFSVRDLRALEVYYASQLTRHQTPQQKVGWRTQESQRVRFEALAEVGPLEGAKILDVGCGLGGLWKYLKEKGLRVDYTGVDLFPRIIREAKQAHPGVKFEVRPLLSRPFLPRSFDYSFLSGVFNVKVRDNWEYMKSLLGCVLRQTRKAVAFNVLNAEAELRESNRFSVHSRELAAFGRRLGVSHVHLMDHYHHLDLTLFLYK